MKTDLNRFMASLSDDQLAECIRDTNPKKRGKIRPTMRVKMRAIHRACIQEIGARVRHA